MSVHRELQTDHLRTPFENTWSTIELADAMSAAFHELQQQLQQGSIALYMKAGLDRDAAFKAVRLYRWRLRPGSGP
ncbi:MAG: hypothetical protein R3C19_27095 [Planctomycetaceae bacterium]